MQPLITELRQALSNSDCYRPQHPPLDSGMSLPGARKHLPDDLHGQEQGVPQEAPGRGQDDISRGWSRGWPSPVSSEDNSWPLPLRFHLSGGAGSQQAAEVQSSWLWHPELGTSQRRRGLGTHSATGRSALKPRGTFPRGKQCVLHCQCPGQGAFLKIRLSRQTRP